MDHTNFPIARAIPLSVIESFADNIDWDEYYGRWGTETLIYSDYYCGTGIPEHLINKVTHVWMYFEK